MISYAIVRDEYREFVKKNKKKQVMLQMKMICCVIEEKIKDDK